MSWFRRPAALSVFALALRRSKRTRPSEKSASSRRFSSGAARRAARAARRDDPRLPVGRGNRRSRRVPGRELPPAPSGTRLRPPEPAALDPGARARGRSTRSKRAFESLVRALELPAAARGRRPRRHATRSISTSCRAIERRAGFERVRGRRRLPASRRLRCSVRLLRRARGRAHPRRTRRDTLRRRSHRAPSRPGGNAAHPPRLRDRALVDRRARRRASTSKPSTAVQRRAAGLPSATRELSARERGLGAVLRVSRALARDGHARHVLRPRSCRRPRR